MKKRTALYATVFSVFVLALGFVIPVAHGPFPPPDGDGNIVAHGPFPPPDGDGNLA